MLCILCKLRVMIELFTRAVVNDVPTGDIDGQHILFLVIFTDIYFFPPSLLLLPPSSPPALPISPHQKIYSCCQYYILNIIGV